MNVHTHNARFFRVSIGLAALFAGRLAAADELIVERPPILVTVEVDKEALRIDVPLALRAIETSLRDALARSGVNEVQMAAIDSPPRG